LPQAQAYCLVGYADRGSQLAECAQYREELGAAYVKGVLLAGSHREGGSGVWETKVWVSVDSYLGYVGSLQ